MKTEIFSGIGSLLATNPLADTWRRFRSFIAEMKRRAEVIEREIAALRTKVDDLDTKYPFANKLDEELKRLTERDDGLSERVASLAAQLTELERKISARLEELGMRLSATSIDAPSPTGWKRVIPWVGSLVALLLLCGLAFGLGGGSMAQEAQILSLRKQLEDAKADLKSRLSRLNDVDTDYGRRLDRLDHSSSDFAGQLDQLDSAKLKLERRLNGEKAEFEQRLNRLDSAKTDFERRLARIESSVAADRPRRDRPPLCECYEWSR